MIVELLILVSLAAANEPPRLPEFPVIIRTDKPAYVGKDHITVTLHNNRKEPVSVAPFLPIERSEGDGRWTPVYTLRAVSTCPKVPPAKAECVTIAPGEDLTLAAWDWYTGGSDQCPPRRPGKRAFKGVHRITASWCEGKAPPAGKPRVKLVTWE